MTGETGNNGDEDQSNFDVEETDLESFSTVLESNDDIDEFQIFCLSLQRKFCRFSFKESFVVFSELQSDRTGYNQALLQNLSNEQRTQIQNIIHYSEQRKQQKGNDRIFLTESKSFSFQKRIKSVMRQKRLNRRCVFFCSLYSYVSFFYAKKRKEKEFLIRAQRRFEQTQ